MPIQAHTCPGEALLFIHSFRHRLRVTEICSHDANITMATVVARRPSVLQLACSHEQTASQVAIDASTLSQKDCRHLSANRSTHSDHHWVCPKVVWLEVSTQYMEIIATQSLHNKTHLISKQCFNSATHQVSYNFAKEPPIRVSIAPIDAQWNAHSDSTNTSICAKIPIA